MSISISVKRSEIISQIDSTSIYDLAIIGGGIHGAVIARLASQYGLRSVLLEKNDYASGTSSRSSKMAHGGLRYLELFDFQQVLEGVKARDKLYLDYPGQVVPHPFYIPVYQGDYFFRLKLGLGLWIYDLFNSNQQRKHHWVSSQELRTKAPELDSQQMMGCYCYYDGLMSDYRLVIDNITLARENTDCLNYAEVTKLNKSSEATELIYKDCLTNQEHSLNAKFVINTSGNNVDFFGANNQVNLKFSRGSHLLFNRPWSGPALFLPLPGKARYYFVWPHFAGTLVGTTEREILEPVDLPTPSADEITEILERLKKDLPDSGLNQDTLHYSFAGIRALPVSKNINKGTAQISRKHRWFHEDRLLTLYGGKFTTSEWTAREGLKLALEKLGKYSNGKFKALETFPVEKKISSSLKQKIAVNKRLQFNLPFASDCFDSSEMNQIIANEFLVGEVYNAFELEQAITLDDFLYRRTGLGYLANYQQILIQLRPYLDKYLKKEL